MAESPLVSICIPTYNRAKLVDKAIKSALEQDYQNIEVIVVDNASQDNVESVVAGFPDPRIKFFKNQENLGLFGNFNRCIELASGKYVHILHSDDFIEPGFTAKCVAFLENHPSVAMTFTSVHVQTGEKIHDERVAEMDTIYPAPEGFRQILFTRPFINCPTVMVNKEIYRDVGNFSLEYPYSSDFYQWLKISRKYDIAFIRDAFLTYRQGEHTESYRLLFTNPSGYIDTVKIFIRLIDELGEERERYFPEINFALKRMINDLIFAAITRKQYMKNYSMVLFIGLALSTWSLITPDSMRGWLGKTGFLFLIILSFFLVVIPGMCYLIQRVLKKQSVLY
jgi:glycosyltransferase involved in cell wall biosynthesis